MNGSKDMCVMACLAPGEGNVSVIHFDKNSHTITIAAHLSSISAIALNHDGTLLATSSTKGQVFRIFSTETGQQIQELRRGTDQADVFSLSFDPVSKYIGCTSDKGTIHIYSIRSDVSLAAMTQKQFANLNTGPERITIPGVTSSQQVVLAPALNTPYYQVEGLSQNPKSMFSFLRGFFPKYFTSEWSFAQFHI